MSNNLLTRTDISIKELVDYQSAQTITGLKTFSGGLAGNLEGNVTGNVTGNADTATALASSVNIHGVSFDGSGHIDLSEVIQDTVGAMITSSNTETGISVTYDDNDGTIDLVVGTLNQNTTGNALTATTLENARTIGGVSFNGSADIDLPGVNTAGSQDTSGTAAIATKVTVADESADTSCSVLFTTTATGNLSPKSVDKLTFNASTGNLTATGGFTGALAGNATTATTASLATSITANANNTANETVYLTFVDGATGTQDIETDTGLSYNPSTGTLTTENIVTTGYIRGPASLTIDPAAHGDATGEVVIAGNLTVSGTTTTVNSETINLADNNIILNSNLASNANPTEDAGIEVNRGQQTNATFMWDESEDKWVLGGGPNAHTRSLMGEGGFDFGTNATGTNMILRREEARTGNSSHVLEMTGLSSGGLTIDGNITAYSTSDQRLKDNIKSIENPLEKVKTMGGYTYTWNKLGEEHSIHKLGDTDVGVIAQEVEGIIPEAVTDRDNGYKAVQYEKLIPLLVECVKEQQNMIEKLQNDINILKN